MICVAIYGPDNDHSAELKDQLAIKLTDVDFHFESLGIISNGAAAAANYQTHSARVYFDDARISTSTILWIISAIIATISISITTAIVIATVPISITTAIVSFDQILDMGFSVIGVASIAFDGDLGKTVFVGVFIFESKY